jgi:hypothetical protein
MSAQAAQNEGRPVATAAADHVNPKVDAFAQGSVMAIDAKAGKFTIRGVKLAYATEYAKMMRDIFNKTQNLQGAERTAKENEIRRSYADDLAKSRTQTEKESDFTFYVPKENDGNLQFFGGDNAKETAGRMAALSDLKIGDKVTVGYEAGAIYNYAYAVIHGTASEEDLTKMVESPATQPAK